MPNLIYYPVTTSNLSGNHVGMQPGPRYGFGPRASFNWKKTSQKELDNMEVDIGSDAKDLDSDSLSDLGRARLDYETLLD